MSHEDNHWHATNECFNCFNCKAELLGQPFLPRKGAVYCSIQCSRTTTTESYEEEQGTASSKVECKQTAPLKCESSNNSINWNSKTSCLDLSEFNSMSLG